MKNANKNCALIGCGYWGRNIFRNLYELNVLSTVCDINLSLIEDYKQKFPQLKCTNSPESVWADKEIKAKPHCYFARAWQARRRRHFK